MAIYSHRRLFLSLRQQFHSNINFNSSISRFNSPSIQTLNLNFRSSPFSSTSVLRKFLASFNSFPLINKWSFRSSFNGVRSFSTRFSESSSRNNGPPKETIMLEGCDFEHWLVVVDAPDPQLTRDDIIDGYIKTLAQIIGSEEEARMKIYSVSTRHYFAFGALISEELSYKLKDLPNVRWVLPDSYMDVKNKTYAGEPFINGEPVPYDPKYHAIWVQNHAESQRSRNKSSRRQKDQNSQSRSPTSASVHDDSNQKWISAPSHPNQAPQTSNTQHQASQPSSASDPGNYQQKQSGQIRPVNTLNEDVQSSQMQIPDRLQNQVQNPAPPTYSQDQHLPPATQKNAPPAYYQNQAPPTFQNQAPPTFQNQAPPTFQNQAPTYTQVKPTTTFQNQAPPTYSQNQAPPNYSQNQAPPTYSQNRAPPTYSQIQAPPIYSQIQAHPTYSQNQVPPTYSQNHAPPTFSQNQARPNYSQNQAPPTYSQNQVPPTYSQSQMHPNYYQYQAPPSYSQNQAPPTYSQNQAPPTYSHNQAPPIYSQNQAPPTYSQNQVHPNYIQNQAPSTYSHNQAPQPSFMNYSTPTTPPHPTQHSGTMDPNSQVWERQSHSWVPPGSSENQAPSHMHNQTPPNSSAPNPYDPAKNLDNRSWEIASRYQSHPPQHPTANNNFSYNNMPPPSDPASNVPCQDQGWGPASKFKSQPSQPQISKTYSSDNFQPSAPARDMPLHVQNTNSHGGSMPSHAQQNEYLYRDSPLHAQSAGTSSNYPSESLQQPHHQDSHRTYRDMQRSMSMVTPQSAQNFQNANVLSPAPAKDVPSHTYNPNSSRFDVPVEVQQNNDTSMDTVQTRDYQERDNPTDDYLPSSKR